MAALYFDSSGIVKRYVREIGTVWVRGLTAPAARNRIYLARITGVEVVSAVSQRQRAGSISVSAAANVLARFRREFANRYRMIDATSGVVVRAMELAETHALRGYDAVQLASALRVNARWLARGLSGVVLVSADLALNTAAALEGLTVENPSNHP